MHKSWNSSLGFIVFGLKLKPESTPQLCIMFEQSAACQWVTLLWLRLLRYAYIHMRENSSVFLSSHLCICRLSVTEVNHMLQPCTRTANLLETWYSLFVFLLINPAKNMNKLGYQVTAFLLLLTCLNYFTEIFCICFWREQIKFGPCVEHSTHEWRWPQNCNIFLFANTPIFQILGDICYIHILFLLNSYRRKLLRFYGFRREQAKKNKKSWKILVLLVWPLVDKCNHYSWMSRMV